MSKKKTSTNANQIRPPIVTVMGHVDHGKTSLLDYIRKSRVAAKEAGGITQHIGAYQVQVPGEKKNQHKLITFIDTPGHAAFEKMRSRGGQTADIVVLVISATEGIKPQTEESLKHIQKAQVPYIIALNKIDLPQSNPEKVKNELTQIGVLTEDRGGQVIAVPVSALKGTGVDDLLETILLVAEMEELKSQPEAPLRATIIESHLDARRGPIATAIITAGTLRIRDEVAADKASGRIKAILDDAGKGIKEAGPSTPVQVLGFSDVPPVGSIMHLASESPSTETNTDSANGNNNDSSGVIKIYLRADTSGSLEAIQLSLSTDIQVINAQVGEISENDILMAKAGNAQVIGFNTRITSNVQELAETEGVIATSFDIIYKLLEYTQDQVLRTSDPYYDKDILGEAEVKAIFQIDKTKILGGKVAEGELSEGVQIDIRRAGKYIGTSRISSLRNGKDIVKKAERGHEFGAQLSQYVDFRVGDSIIAHKPKK